ncbi:MAG: phenylalanine--tRNA ligase subunit beta, partial [Gemmataceae bacterium]|nr:phenylalanine--tRNA ligase subunit beta [Gemmataceae bacterium]
PGRCPVACSTGRARTANPCRGSARPLACPADPPRKVPMRVPLSWLREYVDLPADPAALVERLTLAGLEASGVEVFGLPAPPGLRPKDPGPAWDRDKVVVGKVLKIDKHPDADKLKLVTIDHGAGEPKTVVTGAPNIAPGESGMKVVLGLRGTKYFYTDKDGKKAVFTLEPKALRGIMNDAMCMSNFELGISDEHEGIIILDDADPAPGTPAVDVLGDVVVELDVLPNMARCLALTGIAREVAALTGGKLHIADPKVKPAAEPVAGKVQVEIADPKRCGRYTATVIRNVTVGPAPRWMRSRLDYAGMRPISNVVDITNYVMLETGQPLHAFDYDVLVKRAGGKAPTIIVRPAKPGEKLVTLDKAERELSPDNLVIADTAGPIALAGVMGGLETEVTDATKTILLESASFDFVSVRKTARQFNLFSEASGRFSKGVHPEQSAPAAARAAQLFQDLAGGEVLAGIVDAYPAPVPPQTIALTPADIRRLLGFDIPPAEVERVLTALQFTVKKAGDGWSVTTPPTRLDIQAGAADLVEELARVYGYDKLPETLLAQALPEQRGNRPLELEEQVRDLLADAGLQECVTYSLGSPEAEARLEVGKTPPPNPLPRGEGGDQTAPLSPPPFSGEGAGGRGHVQLLNPVSPERSVLRTTLLPGLLAVAHANLEAAESVALFEVGPVYLAKPGAQLPDEPRRLAVVLCGRRSAAAWDDPLGAKPAAYDFFDLKGILGTLAADLHLPGVSVRKATNPAHLHPGRSAELVVNGAAVGTFGELHPKVAAAFGKGFADRAVQVAELDLEAVLAAVPDRFPYRPFPTVPPAKRDIALIVPEETPAEAVLGEIRAAGGDLLTDAVLFDVYTGESVPAGTKSLAYALVYQSPDKTLSDKEIEKAHGKVEGRLRHVLKAKIRGKDA